MSDWNLACPDWEERLRDGRMPIPDLPLVRDEAEIAVAFFDQLRLPDVPGNPTMAEAAGDWARDLIAVIFGSWDPVAQVRHIKDFFALISKKNSKTTYLGAGGMLTALFMNRRPRAEFMFVGPSQAIADLAYSQAEGMVALDPELKKRFKPREHLKEIIDLTTRAKLKIRTFDLSILTGPRPAGVFVDELHELGRMAAASKVLIQLRGGRQAIPEGFLIIATTQSVDRPAGAFKEELEAAREIRDGKRAGRMLPIIYEFPTDIGKARDRWANSANWPMVMPNLGRPFTIPQLEEEFRSEQAKGEAKERLWASQHLNVEIGVGYQSDRWPGAEFWDRRGDASLTLAKVLARSEVVVVGIDGGGLDDLFGLAVLGRDKETKDWLLWSHAWCHEGVLERRKSIAAQLKDFEAAKELTIVDDELGDLSAIIAHIEAIKDKGLLAVVAVDPAGLGELVDELDRIGVTQENNLLIGVGQGYKLMNAIKTAERRLANGTLLHGGSSLMAWCVGNLKIEPTATAIRATKQNAGDAKIDPVMAMFNAVERMSLNPETTRSVYEEHGLLVL